MVAMARGTAGVAVFCLGVLLGAPKPGNAADEKPRLYPDPEAHRKPGEVDTSRPITVRTPQHLGTATLPAERIYMGKYYKPCVIRLRDDQLRFSGRATAPYYDFTRNPFWIQQSADGGKTWTPFCEPPFGCSEDFMTVLRDGTVFMTFAGSWRRAGDPEVPNTIYRSADGCRTWQAPGPRGRSDGTRNVLQLLDGSLIWGQPECQEPSSAHEKDTVWRSTDGGRTWPEKYPARFEGRPAACPMGAFCEMFLWQSQGGRLFGIARVDFRHYQPIPGKEVPTPAWIEMVIDQSEGMLLYQSDDLGRTWQPVRYLGDYGQHYPSILRLADGRLLLTYSVRDPIPHETGLVGTSAVLGSDAGNELQFDFEHDVITIEARKPFSRQPFRKGDPWVWNPRGGSGGWSPTVQITDGTLVTAYSYRTGTSDDADQSESEPCHTEVARWRLPSEGN
jgi:hypothetical protein